MAQERLKTKEMKEQEEVKQEEKPKVGNILRVGSDGKFDKYIKSIWMMLGADYDEVNGFYIYYPLSLESMGKQVVEATERFGCRIVSTTTKQIEREVEERGKILIKTYPNVVVQIKQVSAAR